MSDPFEFDFDNVLGGKDKSDAVAEPAQSSVGSARPKMRRSKRYSALNDRMSYFVAGSAIFTAVPIGLNRPSFWLVWGLICTVLSVLYFALGAKYSPDRKLLVERTPWMFGLAMLVPLCGLLQAVPLGALGAHLGWPLSEANVTAQISVVPSASVLAAVRFGFYILFAVLCIEVASRRARAQWIGWVIFFGAVAHAVWALVALRMLGDVHFWGVKEDYLGSATGVFLNRNSLATFLSMGACVGFALLLDIKNRPRMRHARPPGPFSQQSIERLLIWLGLAVVYLAVVQTQSRMGAVAGMLGGVTCFLIMQLKSNVSALRVFGGLFVAFVGVFVAFIGFSGAGVLERSVFLGGDLEMRANGYMLVADLIAARPLSGFGLDSFRPAFELVHGLPLSGNHIWDRAHSTYLSHWAELGLFFGSVPLLVVGLAFMRLCVILRRNKYDFALTAASISALVVAATHSLVDFSLEMPANVILLIAIVGLGLAPRADKESGGR